MEPSSTTATTTTSATAPDTITTTAGRLRGERFLLLLLLLLLALTARRCRCRATTSHSFCFAYPAATNPFDAFESSRYFSTNRTTTAQPIVVTCAGFRKRGRRCRCYCCCCRRRTTTTTFRHAGTVRAAAFGLPTARNGTCRTTLLLPSRADGEPVAVVRSTVRLPPPGRCFVPLPLSSNRNS
uniref:Uncharacterized protein n=1 Tax=Anopheles coluzzii TaxID=1518534 RepID=A0A8W7Q251_ANOCL